MMKILLLNLPREWEVRSYTTPDYLIYDFMKQPPLGLLAIAAGLDRRHSVEVLDTSVRNMSIEDVIAYVRQSKPDLLGISVVTRRLYPFFAVSGAIKEEFPEIIIVAGGPHINVFPKETIELGTADFVLPGYGELRFSQLIEAIDNVKDAGRLLQRVPGLHYRIDGCIKVTPDSGIPLNLDDLPFPDRSLVNLNDYFSAADRRKMTTAYTARGCPFRCTFCDAGEKVFRYRSPQKTVDEFQNIAARGIEEIHILDDTFNVSRQRVIDLCHEILNRGLKISWSARARVIPFDREMALLMKKAGCRRLHVGVEAFDDDILRSIRKDITTEQVYSFFAICNEFKIDTLAYFMVGFPQETEEYRRTLYKKLRKLNATYVYVSILYPTAKSDLYSDMLKMGQFSSDFWHEFIIHPVKDFDLPLFRSPALQEDLSRLADGIHRKFYLSPRFIIAELRRNPNLRMLLLKVKLAMKLLFRPVLPAGNRVS